MEDLIKRMDTWTLVMLTEYMDHSLVMLARKMCWSLEDVAYYALKVSHGKKVRTVNCVNPRTPDRVCEPPWWEGRSRSSVFSSVCSLSLSLSPLSLSLSLSLGRTLLYGIHADVRIYDDCNNEGTDV